MGKQDSVTEFSQKISIVLNWKESLFQACTTKICLYILALRAKALRLRSTNALKIPCELHEVDLDSL